MTICLSQNRNQLCAILGFVLLLSPIDLLQGLKTENAYNMEVCPLNKTEWQKASQRLNCTDDMENPVNRYHCLPVDDLTTLVEFCYNQIRPRIVKGLCMVYVQEIKTLHYYNCSSFEEGCPDTNYFSDESYEFSRCIQIDITRRCYLAEPSCRPATHKSNDGRIPVALFISSAAVSVVILMTIAATYKWRRRGCHNGTVSERLTSEIIWIENKDVSEQLEDIVLSDIDEKPVKEVTHISHVTSEIIWIENKDCFMKIDHSGRILFKREINVFWGCLSFTVDENGDVFYIEKEKEVIKMSSTGENPTQLLKVKDPFTICNICSARLTGEILLRVYFLELNKHSTYIERYNKNGERLSQFKYNEYEKLHTSPWFVSVNINGNICVSDQFESKVQAFDVQGTLLYSYGGFQSQTFDPMGICNDLFGHVLVCNCHSSNPSVHLLDENGEFLKMIVCGRGDVKEPWGLCADNEGKLYLGQKNCSVIKVFNILESSNI